MTGLEIALCAAALPASAFLSMVIVTKVHDCVSKKKGR